MQNPQPSLFTRPDTILGACEGIGEDFGFNAQILRVGLAAMLFWSPVAAIATYALIGLLVLFTRWLYPNPVPSTAPHHVDGTVSASMLPSAERSPLPSELAIAA